MRLDPVEEMRAKRLVTEPCYGCGRPVSVDRETAQAARDGAIVRCVDCKGGHHA